MVADPFVDVYHQGHAVYTDISHGDWEGATEHAYEGANDVATIALMVDGGAGLARGIVRDAALVKPTPTEPVTLLGRKADIEAYMASKSGGVFDADFLNIRGTMAGGKKGVGGWNWTRNKRFIDDALDSGKEIRLVTDPNAPLYEGGNTYQRELRYLKDRGYRPEQVGDYWRVVRARP
jgi:hypothetical protein